jgi:hypothetical protein
MFSLKEKIIKDLNRALKEKKIMEVTNLRLILAEISNKEKEKRYKISKTKKLSEKELRKESQLTDQEILEVLVGQIKKRKEAKEAFEKGKREDLAKKEKEELEILKRYLPPELSDEELKQIVKKAIKDIGAKDIKDFGKIMSFLIPKIKGRADNKKVAEIVRKTLLDFNKI